jgi:hypothetical protein
MEQLWDLVSILQIGKRRLTMGKASRLHKEAVIAGKNSLQAAGAKCQN